MLALLLVSLASWAGPPPASPPSGDATICARVGDSKMVITTTSRLAGAIHSLTWDGKEFIDSYDHGRQLQSAVNLDCGKRLLPETFNPTEAGSRFDDVGRRSSSKLLGLTARGNELSTRTQMAFWLRPGEKSNGHLAYNTTILSNHRIAKRVRIGWHDNPHILDHRLTFTLPPDELHTKAVFEALTGYMPPEFSLFWKYDDKSGQLLPLSDGPGEQPCPIVFSTRDGKHAMGIYSPHRPAPSYGRWRFKAENVVKWNCVCRVSDRKGIRAGDFSFQLFVIVGTRMTCAKSLKQLHDQFRK